MRANLLSFVMTWNNAAHLHQCCHSRFGNSKFFFNLNKKCTWYSKLVLINFAFYCLPQFCLYTIHGYLFECLFIIQINIKMNQCKKRNTQWKSKWVKTLNVILNNMITDTFHIYFGRFEHLSIVRKTIKFSLIIHTLISWNLSRIRCQWYVCIRYKRLMFDLW